MIQKLNYTLLLLACTSTLLISHGCSDEGFEKKFIKDNYNLPQLVDIEEFGLKFGLQKGFEKSYNYSYVGSERSYFFNNFYQLDGEVVIHKVTQTEINAIKDKGEFVKGSDTEILTNYLQKKFTETYRSSWKSYSEKVPLSDKTKLDGWYFIYTSGHTNDENASSHYQCAVFKKNNTHFYIRFRTSGDYTKYLYDDFYRILNSIR